MTNSLRGTKRNAYPSDNWINKKAKLIAEFLEDDFRDQAIASNFRFHGNWCGPGWSAGQFKPAAYLTSEDWQVPAIDNVDLQCKNHDMDLAEAVSQEQVNKINEQFVDTMRALSRELWYTNWDLAIKCIAMANAVFISPPKYNPFMGTPQDVQNIQLELNERLDAYEEELDGFTTDEENSNTRNEVHEETKAEEEYRLAHTETLSENTDDEPFEQIELLDDDEFITPEHQRPKRKRHSPHAPSKKRAQLNLPSTTNMVERMDTDPAPRPPKKIKAPNKE